MVSNITCSTKCKYRTGATLYTLETLFVSGTKVIYNNKGSFSLHPTRLCTSHLVINCPATPVPSIRIPVTASHYSNVKGPFQSPAQLCTTLVRTITTNHDHPQLPAVKTFDPAHFAGALLNLRLNVTFH